MEVNESFARMKAEELAPDNVLQILNVSLELDREESWPHWNQCKTLVDFNGGRVSPTVFFQYVLLLMMAHNKESIVSPDSYL